MVIAFYLLSAWLLRRRRGRASRGAEAEPRVPVAVAEW